jgi:hypothetical protein
MAIINITQKSAESGVFVAISWKFCVARILTTVHKSCDKLLYASYGEHYNLQTIYYKYMNFESTVFKITSCILLGSNPSGGKIF